MMCVHVVTDVFQVTALQFLHVEVKENVMPVFLFRRILNTGQEEITKVFREDS